jgi:hypothetical protein
MKSSRFLPLSGGGLGLPDRRLTECAPFLGEGSGGVMDFPMRDEWGHELPREG